MSRQNELSVHPCNYISNFGGNSKSIKHSISKEIRSFIASVFSKLNRFTVQSMLKHVKK